MDIWLKPPLRALAFFVLAAAFNELCLLVIPARILLLIWAFMFLWMFNDSLWVAMDLTFAEKRLSDQKHINDILQAQNFSSSLQLLKIPEFHRLLQEIKQYCKHPHHLKTAKHASYIVPHNQDSLWMLDLHQKLNVPVYGS